jgi:hypothetical protein
MRGELNNNLIKERKYIMPLKKRVVKPVKVKTIKVKPPKPPKKKKMVRAGTKKKKK